MMDYLRPLGAVALIAISAWLIGLIALHVFPIPPVACYYSGNNPPQPLTD